MTTEEILEKKQSGDWITLGKKLNCDTNAAKMRFRRGNPDAFKAMEKIVVSRDKVINETP